MEDRRTILFNSSEINGQQTTEDILRTVYNALEERGYNAIDQMVGYILSGDPSYITGHNNARNLIRRIERDDLVEELLRAILKKKRNSADMKFEEFCVRFLFMKDVIVYNKIIMERNYEIFILNKRDICCEMN